jgi:hypothetical protein
MFLSIYYFLFLVSLSILSGIFESARNAFLSNLDQLQKYGRRLGPYYFFIQKGNFLTQDSPFKAP